MSLQFSRYSVISMCIDQKRGQPTSYYIRTDTFAAPRFARDLYKYMTTHTAKVKINGKEESVFLHRDGVQAISVRFEVALAQAKFEDGVLDLEGEVD